MAYRIPSAAPVSRVPDERRGRRLGKFCLECSSVYPTHAASHQGKPVNGKDHVSAPCTHEGDRFAPGEDWWEEAVEVLPAPPAADEEDTADGEARA